MIFAESIDPDDIYNLDETGFAMGLIANAKVITRAEKYARRFLLQPGNHEWVVVIQCTGASAWALPPCVILEGKVYIKDWADSLPRNWHFEVSPNG